MVLGAAVMAHFGNNVRTFGYASHALTAPVSFERLAGMLKECSVATGTLFSPNCMSASGFSAVGGNDYVARYKDRYHGKTQADESHVNVSTLARDLSAHTWPPCGRGCGMRLP